MKIKTIIAVLLVLLMASVTAFGCAAPAEETEPSAAEEAAQAPAEETASEEAAADEEEAETDLPLKGKKIGFAHLTLMDEWCVSVADAMEKIGYELGAEEVNVQVAEFDLETQVKDIENFINQQYDAIFILLSQWMERLKGTRLFPTSFGTSPIPVRYSAKRLPTISTKTSAAKQGSFAWTRKRSSIWLSARLPSWRFLTNASATRSPS
jgi:hypothetical protein